MLKQVVTCGIALALCGCASIISGTTEEVTVNTNPSGANCAIDRNGKTIANVSPTPAAATIEKTKYEITIVCDKDGYQEATYIDRSGIQASTWGNIVLGGGIGWAIDSARGADNYYESPINITMVPKPDQLSAPSVTPHASGEVSTPNAPGS